MNWDDLGRAFALYLVLEGIMPFLAPRRLRRILLEVAGMDNRGMRVMGLLSMLAGLLILRFLR